jgi:hypothetical protein
MKLLPREGTAEPGPTDHPPNRAITDKDEAAP